MERRARWMGPRSVLLATMAMLTITAVSSGSRSAAATRSWQPIARAPISGRLSASVVWTGRRMIVWGGFSGRYGKEAVADGAIYDPRTDRWRAIAPAPRRMLGGGGQAAAWTGKRAIIWVGNSPDGPVRAGAYDPVTDRWRKLRAGPLGRREGYVSVWTGKELVVIGGTVGDGLATPIAAALDPRTDRWWVPSGLDRMDGLQPSGAVWSGDRLFVAGLAYDCSGGYRCSSSPVFLSFDPTIDEATTIDLASAPTPSIAPIAWTGSEVFATGADPTDVVLYDPEADAWRSGDPAPCAARPNGYQQSAWLDGRYVTACGGDALQIYDLASDSWQTIQAGSSPMNHRDGSAIAWTGRRLVVWSGTVARPGNPTPNSGMSVRPFPWGGRADALLRGVRRAPCPAASGTTPRVR